MEHFHFLFEEFVAFAELTKFSILGTRDAGFLALFDAFLSESFIEGSNVDAEVFRDLRQCHFRAAIQRDPHDVVTELFGITKRHRFILPGQPKLAMLMSPTRASDPIQKRLRMRFSSRRAAALNEEGLTPQYARKARLATSGVDHPI